jgi:hypothetical protein
MSQHPPKEPRTKSGQHPSVQGYRRKLESLEQEADELARINDEVEAYLADLRSSRPPAVMPPLSRRLPNEQSAPATAASPPTPPAPPAVKPPLPPKR